MGALALSMMETFNEDLFRENSFDSVYPINEYQQHQYNNYEQYQSENEYQESKIKKTISYTDIKLFDQKNANIKHNLIVNQCLKYENVKMILNFELVEKMVNEDEYIIDQHGIILNKV